MAAVAAVATPPAVAPARNAPSSSPAAKAGDGAASFDQALGAAGGNTSVDAAKTADASAKPKPASASKTDDDATKDEQAEGKTAPVAAADGGVVAWMMNLIGAQPAGAAHTGNMAATAAAPQADAKTAAAVDVKATPAASPAPASGKDVATTSPLPASIDADGDDDAAPAAKAPALHAEPAAAAAVHTQAAAAQTAPPDGTTQSPFSATLQLARLLDGASAAGAAVQAQPAAAQPHTALPQDRDSWAETLSDQVRWQLGQDVREARLELHPRDLGSVQVQVRVTSEGTEVRFAAEHPQAREALQQALPQLRSLLAGDGQQLLQAQVGSQSQSSRQFNLPFQAAAGSGGDATGEGEGNAVVAAPGRSLRIGLLDDFA